MTFITKRHLSRRTFLRGAGVTVGHVFVDARTGAVLDSYDEVRADTGRGFYNGTVTINVTPGRLVDPMITSVFWDMLLSRLHATSSFEIVVGLPPPRQQMPVISVIFLARAAVYSSSSTASSPSSNRSGSLFSSASMAAVISASNSIVPPRLQQPLLPQSPCQLSRSTGWGPSSCRP